MDWLGSVLTHGGIGCFNKYQYKVYLYQAYFSRHGSLLWSRLIALVTAYSSGYGLPLQKRFRWGEIRKKREIAKETVDGGGGERERRGAEDRGGERETETDRQTDRQRQKQIDRHRDRQRHRDAETDTQRDRD